MYLCQYLHSFRCVSTRQPLRVAFFYSGIFFAIEQNNLPIQHFINLALLAELSEFFYFDLRRKKITQIKAKRATTTQ